MQVLKKDQAETNVEAIKVKEESLEIAGERCWKPVRRGLQMAGELFTPFSIEGHLGNCQCY